MDEMLNTEVLEVSFFHTFKTVFTPWKRNGFAFQRCKNCKWPFAKHNPSIFFLIKSQFQKLEKFLRKNTQRK